MSHHFFAHVDVTWLSHKQKSNLIKFIDATIVKINKKQRETATELPEKKNTSWPYESDSDTMH